MKKIYGHDGSGMGLFVIPIQEENMMKHHEKLAAATIPVRIEMLKLIEWHAMYCSHQRIPCCPSCLSLVPGKHKENCELHEAIVRGQKIQDEIPNDDPSDADCPPNESDWKSTGPALQPESHIR
jgi:hypothetical protein